MSKPKWLKDKESGVQRYVRSYDMCENCIYFGSVVGYTRRHDGQRAAVHECDIHPNCLNTEHSICCDDFCWGEML